jgi:predicted phage baseplate assembly protein
MPLQDDIPRIDDRRYDDIVAELRTRIARYTPEWQPVWTDVNDNDPGITLVQLFAWLSEMLLYRMGRVPQLNYIKFLQLLGIELQPAQPARAEITFPVLQAHPEPYVTVPARSQLAAETDEGSVVFETERTLIALTAQLDAVQAYDGYAYRDVSRENDNADEPFQPFGPQPAPGSALLMGFNDSGDIPEVPLDITFWAQEESGGIRNYDCGASAALVTPPATTVWEYWAGSQWRALNVLQDATRAFTRSGLVQLRTPVAGAMKQAVVGKVEDPRHWIRARLAESSYERSPALLAVRTNTVSAVQAETVRHEVLGGSNGRPNQLFRLDNAPVLAASLLLEVDEGDDYRPWQQVDDFYRSAADDRHFVLNRTTAEIRFGDGVHGRIPVANPGNPAANVVAREYRVGGGKLGNVVAGKISAMLTSVSGVDANRVGNLKAAHSGREEETLDEARLRAPQSLKNKDRAVTAEDFEALARQAGNVRRAKALPLYHPNFPDVQVPGVVTVIVVPDSDQPTPLPSEGTLRSVCAYLNERRLLTTELYVIRPRYRQVAVRAEVLAVPTADVAELKHAIQQSLTGYFHPLVGGEDGQGWPFGGDIYFSLVYRRVLEIREVERIQKLEIILDGEPVPGCTDVTLEPGTLLYSTDHEVLVL